MPPITRAQTSATVARTVTVGTASGLLDIAFDTGQDLRTMTLTNLDAANDVWVTWVKAAATVEGDDCILIRPGESISIPNYPAIYGIAVAAAAKVHAWLTV